MTYATKLINKLINLPLAVNAGMFTTCVSNQYPSFHFIFVHLRPVKTSITNKYKLQQIECIVSKIKSIFLSEFRTATVFLSEY